MSSPSNYREVHSLQLVPATAVDEDGDASSDIPRRLMRVKILYTFDDQNKSNCLARLPYALNIPTVSLDETTQVGVIELKACIQTIVAASPELVAKLGHDYTVYAYDYSEYETPLVGQGMLSWILASASSTPSAPAHQSQTMVTGRVCKNILGLFSNGIKETLEVRLKLVPVPTCLQSEYVENMERYRSLSKIMPEGLDYAAWADFLKANPAIGQLAKNPSENTSQRSQRSPVGGVESFHQMLTRPMPTEEESRSNRSSEQRGLSYSAQGTRASSPAMSTASFNPYQVNQDAGSRPVSRASIRSETTPQSRNYASASGTVQDQNEEGPPKKRARVTKAKRPKKTVLGVNNDSLRVTASTAASVRLHRPIPTNPATAIASIEQVPRAPTPRPEDMGLPQQRPRGRPAAPSALRHGSMDESTRYASPYLESGLFSDNVADSADDERGGSAGETPMEIPSSPPVIPQRIASSAPSSPGLPSLPYPADSGFVSDLNLGRDEDDGEIGGRGWEGSDLPLAAEMRIRRRQDRSQNPWTEVAPGPMELLPKTYVPIPKAYPRPRATSTAEKPETANNVPPPELSGNFPMNGEEHAAILSQPQTECSAATNAGCPNEDAPSQSVPQQLQQSSSTNAGSPDAAASTVTPSDTNITSQPSDRTSTPRPAPPKRSKPSKPRGLPRSHTWSEASREPMSDAAVPVEGITQQPRSGSGAKRRQNIKDKLDACIAAGEMPAFCNNCGEIDTPTWRKTYARLETGTPADIKVSTDGSGIVGFEIVEPADDDEGPQQYRIFKQVLEQEEKDSGTFQLLQLCNPCGLWLNKKGNMRPPNVWQNPRTAPNPDKPKRKRNPPKGPRKKPKGQNDDIRSDAPIPHSEPVMPNAGEVPASTDGSADHQINPSVRSRASGFETNGAAGAQLNEATAAALLRRAIQSSPAGFRRGSKDSPIDLEPELTPKPTRRLLFPSPRRAGEVKSLADNRATVSPTTSAPAPKNDEPARRTLDRDVEDNDKENCPPPVLNGDDDLAHLFEDPISPKTTPTKGPPLQDLLKTPTPRSRCVATLTPKRGDENSADPFGIGLTTPTRSLTTPNRSGRAATVAPLTPFTAQLNALLSDGLQSSPIRNMDLSAFGPFPSPRRTSSCGVQYVNFATEDFMSSDLPMPSSPPPGLGFSLYEDPETATIGLWSGPSIFEGSDAVMPEQQEACEAGRESTVEGSKTHVTVDFAAIIREVVGDGENSGKQEREQTGDGEEDAKPMVAADGSEATS
ncbi:hypothetical protein K469DRAFT_637249 [Zopfia rhizophila CBS 207.26]|uniref:Ams2/SPT21 N-terminal domain-containing protein n=1 Tax=Zopfia rhizophila CBS 207.26 TaxID=1314779 RepID=A0A6A6DQS0_9PEZI|nr:hypothetical protein K469DRAFT_637249 [Zopfia rhizophila CBS 207.26]